MSKVKFAAAKELIDEKDYAGARAILKGIDHPTARAWEAKLNDISHTTPSVSRPVVNYVIVATIAGIVGLLIGFGVGNNVGSRFVPSQAAQADYSKITDVKTSLDAYCGIMKLTPYCSDWTDYILSNHLDTARKCLTMIDWERNIEPFGQCLLDNNALLYITNVPSPGQLTATVIVAANEAVENLLNATGTAAVQIATNATEKASICDPQEWWNTVDRSVIQFLDTAKTASSTSRISLSGVILNMREAMRDFEDIDHPDCVDEIYYAISGGMDFAIQGFDAFMAQSDIVSSVELDLATQYFYNANQALLKNGLIGSTDMFNTAVFIWGGKEPQKAAATSYFQTQQAPIKLSNELSNLYSTATAQAPKPK